MTSAASWRAIGTTVDVLVSGADVSLVRPSIDAVIDAADRAFSRFRPDSELRSIPTGTGRHVDVSPMLAAAIEAGLRGAMATGGGVDPTIGRSIRLLGYDRDFALLAADGQPAPPRFEAVPGWRAIDWDGPRRRLRIPRGIELDFGATGKGLIADLAAERALTELPAGAGVLVSLGGDIALAGPSPADGWHVLMAEDSATRPDGPGEVVVLRDGALATSSITVRRWQAGRTTVHHIVDPRTGRPAGGPWRTASVVAATCVDANIASTAAILLGVDAAGWLDDQGLPARLVAHDGRVVRIGAWPDPIDERGPIPSPFRQPVAPRLS